MRQFDAFQNPSFEARKRAPFLVVLSSHHLHDLAEVIVAPAVGGVERAVGGLELPVEIDGESLTLLISELFSLDGLRLRGRVESLAQYEDEIRRALDRLFTGF